MPIPSPSDARTELADLLNDTVFAALGLKQCLLDERQALDSQDMARIEDSLDAKSALVATLKALDERRAALCAACGFAVGADQMSATIEWCDQDQLIESRWDNLLVIAAESSALNLTNGAIIRLRQQQFEEGISTLRGETPGANIYGRQGSASSGHSHRSLAQA